MPDRKKVTLSLTDEALNALNQHATERKRGEFVSELILDFERNASMLLDYTPMENSNGSLHQIMQSLDSRLERIEQLLAENLP